jgi:hypothetical protein
MSLSWYECCKEDGIAPTNTQGEGTMWRKIALFSVVCLLFGVMSFGSEQYVSEDQMASVKSELELLESELQDSALGSDETFVEALDDLRNELVYLEVKMRKHHEKGGAGTGVTVSELEELGDGLAKFRADVQIALRGDASSEAYGTLPAGTLFNVRLLESLSTATARQGDHFSASVIDAVVEDGIVVIPRGALLEGVVESADRPEGRTDRTARLILAFDGIEIEGRSVPLTATVVSASEKMETGLGDEKAKIGLGAGVGAVLGAIFGGKKGALAGIIIGGSGAVLATEGKDVDLPRGTVLELRLDRDLKIPTT